MIIFIAIALAFLIYRFTLIRPSQNRNWTPERTLLSQAEIQGDLVTITNIRNFTYNGSEQDFNYAYYDKTFDLSKIVSAQYAVVPFGSIPGVGHVFMSFEFEGAERVAISIEPRFKVGEKYSLLRSFFQPYEIIFIVGDENDIIKVRTNFRKNELVHFYPLRADKTLLQKLFLGYMKRINSLHDRPEFFRLFKNNCASNVTDLLIKECGCNIPLNYKYFMPAFSDAYLLENGLLDTDLPIEKAREKYFLNEKAKQIPDTENFSEKIREEK